MSTEGRRYREQATQRRPSPRRRPLRRRADAERRRPRTITADRFVVAAGSRPVIPDLPGLDASAGAVPHLRHDHAAGERARALVIVGGGYVAAEFADVFSAFGTAVTGGQPLRPAARQPGRRRIATRFTELLGRRVRILTPPPGRRRRDPTRRRAASLHQDGQRGPQRGSSAPSCSWWPPDGSQQRRPRAAAPRASRSTTTARSSSTRTSAPARRDVFALGDLCSRHMLKHVANAGGARGPSTTCCTPTTMVATDHRHVPQRSSPTRRSPPSG